MILQEKQRFSAAAVALLALQLLHYSHCSCYTNRTAAVQPLALLSVQSVAALPALQLEEKQVHHAHIK